MIENEEQYEITKAALERFEAALLQLDAVFLERTWASAEPLLTAEREALESQMDDLAAQIAEWELVVIETEQEYEAALNEIASVRRQQQVLEIKRDQIARELMKWEGRR